MLKALLKKQFTELACVFFRNKKTGKINIGKNFIGFLCLYIFAFLSMAAAFTGMSFLFADTLLVNGLDWLYFSIMTLIALLLSVFINSLSTFSMLYLSKDNELLISMPIQPWKILFSRMVPVYAMGFVYEICVLLPAICIYWKYTEITLNKVILPLMMLFICGFIITALTCIIGWVVAMISVRLKNKSIVSTIITALFIFVLYYFQFRSNALLQKLVDNSEQIGAFIDKYLSLIKSFGEAMSGNIIAFLIITGITAVLFAAVYYVLSNTFISVSTLNKGEKKKEKQTFKYKSSNISTALFKKELRHYISSTAYMLNTGIGILILLAGGIASIIFKSKINTYFTDIIYAVPFLRTFSPILIPSVICMISSMDAVTAPSVSLEGKNIWLLQSLPIDTKEVLISKLKLHIVLGSVPAVITAVLLGISLNTDILTIAASCIYCLVFITADAEAGLAVNLKKPMLVWTNETVPVKQSYSVAISLFGGMGASLLLTALFYPLSSFCSAAVYLLIMSLILSVLSYYLYRWLMSKGVKLFSEL